MEWNNKKIETAKDLIEAIDDPCDGEMCAKANKGMIHLFGEALGMLIEKNEKLEVQLSDDENALEDIFTEIEDFICHPNDYTDVMHIDDLLKKLRKRHSKS